MQLLREGRSFSGHERNCAFLNTGSPQFANVSAVTGLDFEDDGRTVAVTDWDHDGDLDLWLGNRTGPRLRLMRNETIRDNVSATDGFVAFRLRGTTSNRDAIGSRVTVVARRQAANSETVHLIQSLQAGDAFLSQSSKTVHFGLGDLNQIDEVIVEWPSGQREIFSDIEPGKRYTLTEGSAEATEWTPRQAVSRLQPSEQPARTLPGEYRTFLANPLPLPLLRYHRLDQEEELFVDFNRPTLLMLWASWCPSCVAELTTLRDHAAQLRDAGLDVLALSLDGLDASQASSSEDASELLANINFPFSTGIATRVLIDKLQIVNSLLFNRTPPMAVPVSYLIDEGGAVVAVYRGSVPIDRLVADLEMIGKSPEEYRLQAVPMAGRWNSPPRQLLPRAVGRYFEQAGYGEDLARYLQLETEQLRQRRAQATTQAARAQLDQQYASAHFSLGVELQAEGNLAESIEHFRLARQAQPENTQIASNLGVLLARTGRLDDAIDTLRAAVELDTSSADARVNLATALDASGRFVDSIPHYQQLLAAHPNAVEIRARLARALLEVANYGDASAEFTRVVQQNPRDARSLMVLAWLLATCPDDTVRNGQQALQITQGLHRQTDGNDPVVLDVLAAAHAETGDFELARQHAKRSIELLRNRQPALQKAMADRLQQYQTQQPHRDPDGKYP